MRFAVLIVLLSIAGNIYGFGLDVGAKLKRKKVGIVALRAKKPEAKEDRLKLLLAGDAGVGKTFAAVQMPKVYYVDTERGADKKQYVDSIIRNEGVYFGVDQGAGDPEEVLKEIEALSKTRHDYRTVVIDSLTTLWEAKADEGARDPKVGTGYNKHRDYADSWAKKLFRALRLLDMNCVIVSHVKDKWEDGKKTGEMADGYKKQRYEVDLVLMLERTGTKRIAMVDKTRYDEFPDRARFEWSYAELASRWGAVRLERESVPIALATPEQVALLNQKVQALAIPAEETEKWLSKADAESFAGLTSEQINKCIAFCDARIAQATAPVKE